MQNDEYEPLEDFPPEKYSLLSFHSEYDSIPSESSEPDDFVKIHLGLKLAKCIGCGEMVRKPALVNDKTLLSVCVECRKLDPDLKP